eukprot:SAG11_NODE_5948_length_1426_cov_3.034665_1_plen_411_part_01
MQFERKGVLLGVVRAFVEAGKQFADMLRYLLADGRTAVGLEPRPRGPSVTAGAGASWALSARPVKGLQKGCKRAAKEGPLAQRSEFVALSAVVLQPRGLEDGGSAVVRGRPEAVPRDQIVQELKAAVGDRVLVMPALADTNRPDPQAASAPLPTFQPLLVDPATSEEQKRAALFGWIDLDGDGVLSRAEYARYVLLLGQGDLTDANWAEQCAQLYEADPAVGITNLQYAASYQRAGKMPLEKEIATVARQLELLAAGAISLRSAWTKYTHGERAVYWNRETKARSLLAPPEGVRRERVEEDAAEFERDVALAQKYDSGELNTESKWVKFTLGERAVYWNRETKAWSLLVPPEGVHKERVKEDAAEFEGHVERAGKYDSGELQPKPPPDPRVRATVVGYDAAADAYLVRDCT